MGDPQNDPAGISRVAECISELLVRSYYISSLVDNKYIMNSIFVYKIGFLSLIQIGPESAPAVIHWG